MTVRILALALSLLVVSCTPKVEPPITIAINPWPGYELLYLAEQKQFFKQAGANIKLLQLGSLSDAQRAYLRGNADGLASTLIEAVQAQILGSEPLNIVMVPDYSNGGDVILASKDIHSIADLKGRTVGCEVSSLGIFILQRALAKSGLGMNDVTIVNIEQSNGEKALNENRIDAFVTYPPASVNILKHKNIHKIFSSAEIPEEIIDVVSLSKKVLDANPQLVSQLLTAWDLALDYYKQHPEESIAIMAKREAISPEEFSVIFNEDLLILNSAKQKKLLNPNSSLQSNINEVCKTLTHIGSIETDCTQFPNIIFDTSSL